MRETYAIVYLKNTRFAHVVPFLYNVNVAKTGYWLGVCSYWFTFVWTESSCEEGEAKTELQNEIFFPTVGFKTKTLTLEGSGIIK